MLAARLLVLSSTFASVILVTGCGNPPVDSNRSEGLTLGNVEWDENVAISSLTKVLLEEELGYDDVGLEPSAPDSVFQDVASGELDAFQDVWMPNHEDRLEVVEGEVELLKSWMIGTTRASLAAPVYMDVRSVGQLGDTGAEKIFGVEPDAAPVGEISSEALDALPLEPDFTYPSATAMLDEVKPLYENEEPFIFMAWSPHWMNREYEFNYLEDPDGVLGDLTKPSRLQTIVRADLEREDPLAYALLDTLLLTNHQVDAMELEIREAGDPLEGARAWIEENEELVDTWTETAKARAGVS